MRLTVLDYLRLARRVPLRELPAKAWGVSWRGFQGLRARWRDRMLCTHPHDDEVPKARLEAWLDPLNPQDFSASAQQLDLAADMVLAHRFDLLGSGLVQVVPGMKAAGVEGHIYAPVAGGRGVNRANRAMAGRLLARCDAGYDRIDWHLDFKSGYRWAESLWYMRVDYGMLPGVDVKVPWELARCQHLPPLALAALWAAPARQEGLVREFRHQVLDFVANNPPRFGVNWCCTMDVAIRAANWVMAYQLLRMAPVAEDPFFEHEFKRTLIAHGRHIIGNLEWAPLLRSNHYLSNLCGLLFVAAQLPQTDETDAWLAFTIPELVHECLSQFHPDGSNFEGSTSYHRLSAEMVAYALALLKRLSGDRVEKALRQGPRHLGHKGPGVDPWTVARTLKRIPWLELGERMARARDFAHAAMRPDGQTIQIGDNDSGRFFRLMPCWLPTDDGRYRMAPDSHAHLVQALSGLLEGQACNHGQGPDFQVISALVGFGGLGVELGMSGAGSVAPVSAPAWQMFPDFGLYVARNDRLWCALRCGPVGQLGNGGHAHNDQLSMEFCADGVAFWGDPGTYLYTPLPERRNDLRSTAAHSTVVCATEQNQWQPGRLGLFSMSKVSTSEVLACDAMGWIGRHHALDGRSTTRTVRWTDGGLTVVDQREGEFMLHFQLMPGCVVVRESRHCLRLERGGGAVRLMFDRGDCVIEEGGYSPAYGLLEPAPRLRVTNLAGRIEWAVRLDEPRGCA